MAKFAKRGQMSGQIMADEVCQCDSSADSILDAKRPQQHVKCAPDFHLNLDFLDTVLCPSA